MNSLSYKINTSYKRLHRGIKKLDQNQNLKFFFVALNIRHFKRIERVLGSSTKVFYLSYKSLIGGEWIKEFNDSKMLVTITFYTFLRKL